MVLHDGEQHFITFAEIGIPPGASHQIDGFAGIPREHNFTGTAGADELGRDRSRPLEQFRGPSTQLVGATMHVGVIAAVVLLKRGQNLTRFLTGGRVIQVDQRATIGSFLLKNREISTISRRQAHDICTSACFWGDRHRSRLSITRFSGCQACAREGSCSITS